jgi:NSS family neurotransmitter:Na+ symporter
MSRTEASIKLGFLTWFVGLGTLFSFNLISDYKLFGMNFFGILDGLTSKIMLPLGGLLMAIFTGYIVKRQIVIDELRLSSIKFNVWLVLIKYIAPIAVTLIFVHGLF